MEDKKYTFNISLSVLNHLGRNLYRNFVTILGEAVSNSWDADADNVKIYLKENDFIIVDDGTGMSSTEFQDQFLKVGYSKRKDGKTKSEKNRPFIGRKGIGKLALLASSEQILVASKKDGEEYVGGIIVNAGLDKAILDDLNPEKYPLDPINFDWISEYTKSHKKGTILYFKEMNDGIKNTSKFIRKILALYFRFSLIDNKFNIFVDDKKVTFKDIQDLVDETQFLWTINELKDPFLENQLSDITGEHRINLKHTDKKIEGFIATVNKPSHLNILGTGEKVSVDLYVNGRLRERNILKHISTDRVAESYMYGQIHFNGLDGEKDLFTSSREGVVADSEEYQDFLQNLRDQIIQKIVAKWDPLRLKNKNTGDAENPAITPKERSAKELFGAVSKDYEKKKKKGEEKSKSSKWIDELYDDAAFNFQSYAECFVSENLVRKYIENETIPLTSDAQTEADQWKQKEVDNKKKANLNIDISKDPTDLNYLGMDTLTYLADNTGDTNSIRQDAKEYKPIRNAVMHTSLLSDDAKNKLTSVYANIKARIKQIITK